MLGISDFCNCQRFKCSRLKFRGCRADHQTIQMNPKPKNITRQRASSCNFFWHFRHICLQCASLLLLTSFPPLHGSSSLPAPCSIVLWHNDLVGAPVGPWSWSSWDLWDWSSLGRHVHCSCRSAPGNGRCERHHRPFGTHRTSQMQLGSGVD